MVAGSLYFQPTEVVAAYAVKPCKYDRGSIPTTPFLTINPGRGFILAPSRTRTMSRNTGVAERERRERQLFRERVKELYELGTKDSLIAMILKVTESQVRHARMRMGLPSLHRQWLRKAVQKQVEEIFNGDEVDLCALVWGLKADGFAVEDIAIRASRPVEEVEGIAAKMPKSWRAMGNGRDCIDFMGRAYRNQLQGSRRGGGKKMVP